MNKILFLEAVRASLEDRKLVWTEPVSEQEWEELFRVAMEQNLLPMIYQAVCSCEAFQKKKPACDPGIKSQVCRQVAFQVMKTEEFAKLYQTLSAQGLQPIVVKGIICRNMYPYPDQRISGDEDLYIPDGTFERYHQALLEAGMKVADLDRENISILHEVSYMKNGGMLKIELHKELFDSRDAAYSGMNEQFANVFANAIVMKSGDTEIRTMDYSDHLLFLIVHAFKHFISSGVGVRQVCDVVMFGNVYGERVDWQRVLGECEKIHAEVFAAAVFDIGYRYLGFDMVKACYPKEWKKLNVDSEEMLEDMLSAGVFGGVDMNRKHSSSITLNAVSAGRQGKKTKMRTIKTVFPSRNYLERRYQYLKKFPFLLPIAWGQRLFQYGLEIRRSAGGKNPVESMEIGNRRIALLKKYKIM